MFAVSHLNGFNADTQNLFTKFARKPYVGNGATGQIIINNLDTDLVWIKNEDASSPHTLYDTVRGVGNRLQANTSNIEGSFTGVSAFNIDGFSLGGFADTNNSGNQYVSFAWKEATNYFDIVTYAGNGSGTLNVAHNLGVSPQFVMIKNRTNSANWACFHVDTGGSVRLVLDASSVGSDASWISVNSSQITLGNGSNRIDYNSTGSNYVAYLFGEVVGTSAFGTYTGTGTTTQQDINVGFAPTIVIVKNIVIGDWLLLQSTGKAWHINGGGTASFNAATARSATSATGFSVGTSGTNANGDYNNLGDTYIYMAWK